MDLVRLVDGAISLDDESSPGCMCWNAAGRGRSRFGNGLFDAKYTPSDIENYRSSIVRPTQTRQDACEACSEGFSARPATALAV